MAENKLDDNNNINIKLTKIEKRNIVEDNDFLRARSRLTVTQFKILLTAISRISVNETKFMRYTFKTKELAEYCGLYGIGTSCYSNLKLACESLMDKKIRLREGKHKEKIFPWVSTIIYDDGLVTIEIHHELKPFLLDLKKDFTKFDSNLIMQFKHYYSMKLYMLLYSKYAKSNSFSNKKEVSVTETIDFEDLKDLLGIEKDKYQLSSGFKRRIIKPACLEIKEITSFDIECKEKKNGKAVVAFSFLFKYNNEKAIEYGLPSYKQIDIYCDDKKEIKFTVDNIGENGKEDDNEEKCNQAIKILMNYKIKGYEKIINKYKNNIDMVLKNINYIINKYGKNNNANISGLIIKSIKEDYVGNNEQNKKSINLEKKIIKEKQIKNDQINLFADTLENVANQIDDNNKSRLKDFINKLEK